MAQQSPLPERPEAPSGKMLSASAFIKRLVLGALLINLFAAALAGIAIYQSRMQYQERAEITTQNLAHVLEEYITGVIDKIDLTLLTVVDEAERQLAAGGIDSTALNRLLAQQQGRQPEILSLRIADADGTVRYGLGVKPGSSVNVGDRDYFTRSRDEAKAGLAIAGPMFARISQKWVIVLARRINRPDGGFAGVVYVNIAVEHLSKTFAAVRIGPKGSIGLRDKDLAVIARHPEVQSGDKTGQQAVSRQARELIVDQGQSTGTYMAFAGADGIERVFSFRKIAGHPFYIFVGNATQDYLAGWRQDSARILALEGLFFLVTLLAAWLIHGSWGRQTAIAEALRGQMDFLNTILDNEPECVKVIASNGNLLQMNRAGLSMLEVDSIIEAKKAGLLAFVLPGYRDSFMALSKRVFEGESGTLEFEITGRRGTRRWLETHATPLRDAQGTVTALVGVTRDITERKQAETRIRDSESRLKEAQRIAQIGSWELDLVNGKLVWSDEIFRIFEIDQSRFGATYEAFLDAIHPDDRDSVNQAYSSSVENHGPYEIAHRLRMPDGRIKWVNERCETTYDNQGKALRSSGTVQDITERKQVEDQLIQYRDHLEEMVKIRTQELVAAKEQVEGIEQRQRIMLEHLPVGVILSSGLEQEMLYQNPRFVEMFGYSVAEFSRVAQWWPLAYPDAAYRARVAEEWNRRLAVAIARQADIEPMEVNITAKDGTVKFISIHATVIGELNFVTFIDLSERKQAEDAIRDSMEKERLLIQQSRLAAMGEMIGNIAHQWRQPLNVLGLLFANLQDAYDFNELTRESLRETVADGHRMIQKMSSTIDDFRNFFRPNKEKEVFGLASAVADALRLIEHSLKDNSISVSVADSGDIRANGFPNELSQVLLNIFTNAKEAIRDRHQENGTIAVAWGCNDRESWITVRDNAGGIPEAILPRIFDPYFTTKEKGTGIGLYMSKMIMEHMHGAIEARNVDGGAEFRLVLPRHEGDRCAAKSSADSSSKSG